MKRIAKTIACIALLNCLALVNGLADIVISDNFESYSRGEKTWNESWSTSIPGTGSAWLTRSNATAASGTVSIVDAAVAGRTGNVLKAHTVASSRKAGITLDLPEAVVSAVGTNEWTISVDFRLDSFTGTGTSLSILTAYNESGSAPGIAFGVDYNGTKLRVQTGNSTTGVAVFSDLYAPETTMVGTWYTLTIKASGADGGKVSFFLSEGGNNVGIARNNMSWMFADPAQKHASFDRIILGGGNVANVTSELYYDNYQMEAIPEPSTAVLFGGILLVAGGASLLRRRN